MQREPDGAVFVRGWHWLFVANWKQQCPLVRFVSKFSEHMKAIILLFFTFSCSLSLLARVGETKDQCRTRYGKELPFAFADTQRLMFEKDKMTVHCFFTNDVCDYIIYVSAEPDPANGRPRLLTVVEIQTLLEANGGGWMKTDLPGYDFSWGTFTAPKPLIAVFSLKTRNFEIATTERMEKERLKEKSKLNGF